MTSIPWDSLQKQLSGGIEVADGARGAYATDASVYQVMPSAVAFPKTDNDLEQIVKFCREHQISLIGRGGGTSLSGQAIGTGMVVDFSRYMNSILKIDPINRLAIVEPGVVLDELNDRLAPFGLHFPPDPATASRATIGGMIGNNACGTRSIVYGRTCDAIESLRCLLVDGTWIETAWLDRSDWEERCLGQSHEAELYRQVDRLVNRNQDEIRARIPDLPRNAAGYSLRAFLPEHERRSLSSLIVGGEGTLGLVSRATLRLQPLPKATTVVVSRFRSIDAALSALPVILNTKPSAVELLDELLIGEAQRNAATRERMNRLLPIDEIPQAVLLVEFMGESPAVAQASAERYVAQMKALDSKTKQPDKNRSAGEHLILVDSARQQQAWEVRRLALGLVSNLPGKAKAVALIEDACIPIDRLPEYNRFVFEQGEKWDLGISAYAHASVGVLHYKVILDLHQTHDRQVMRAVAEACFEKCLEVGGVFSGEHGDGIVRGEFLPKQFGATIYQAFVQIKQWFDPQGLMNPGRKIDAPPLDRQLRYGDDEPDRQRYVALTAQTKSHYRYASQDGLVGAIEQCNGVGACRQNLKGTMCPSYRATRDERDSTRGRANLLRLAISGQLNPPGLANSQLHQSLDLCLACKACKSECPNAVDMAKLKSEALQARWDVEGISRTARFLGRAPQNIARLSRWRQLLGWLSNRRWSKQWLEAWFGIDARRTMPFPSRPSFDTWWRNQSHPLKRSAISAIEAASKKINEPPVVALFVDTWHRFLEPQIAQAVIEVLWSMGVAVTVPNAFDALRSRLSWGLLREAQALGNRLIAELEPLAVAGIPILCIEPSEASALVDDLPDLLSPAVRAQCVAEKVQMAEQYILEQAQRRPGLLKPRTGFADRAITVHPHCHHRALFAADQVQALLSIAGFQATTSQWGCCGMAGSFGYTHFDLSQKIAEIKFAPSIRKLHAENRLIVTTGISCRHQAQDTAGISTYHWAELITG